MPLDFHEDDKPKGPVEFFTANTKSRPQHLEGEVIPELIRRVRKNLEGACSQHRALLFSQVGDVKAQRLALWMVEAYLEKNVLIFDPEVRPGKGVAIMHGRDADGEEDSDLLLDRS